MIDTQPDVMLIDEVLAVGDLKFRAKCIGAIEKLRSRRHGHVIMVHLVHRAILLACVIVLMLSTWSRARSRELGRCPFGDRDNTSANSISPAARA